MFDRLNIVFVASECFYFLSAIIFALLDYGYWSIVYASVINHSIKFVMVWWICPTKTWIKLKKIDFSISKSMVKFGVKYSLSGLFAFFNRTFDILLVGKFFGTASLGFYSKSKYFSNLPVTSINQMINTVLFSSYSKIQYDKRLLLKAYFKSVSIVSLFTIPICIGMFIIAPELILAILGDKWFPMKVPLQILCIMSFFRLISQSTASLYLSLGRPEYNLRISIIHTGAIVLFIFLLIDFGLNGVAISILLAYFIGLGYNIYLLNSIFPNAFLTLLKEIFPSIISSIVMAIFINITKLLIVSLGVTNNLFLLLYQIILGMFVYFLMIRLIKQPLLYEVFSLVNNIFNKKSTKNIPSVIKNTY